jgi:hypothetical protein
MNFPIIGNRSVQENRLRNLFSSAGNECQRPNFKIESGFPDEIYFLSRKLRRSLDLWS